MARPTTKRSPTKRSPTKRAPARPSARSTKAPRETKQPIDAPIIDGSTPAWAAINNKGNERQERGDLEGALLDFTAAIELAPDEVAPRYNRGNARALSGDLEGALQDYSDAIKLDPSFAPAWQRRGLLRQRMNDVDGALGDLNEAVRLSPDEPSALGERAAVRALRADFAGAKTDCERALAIAPADWKHRKGTEHLLETIRKAEAAHVAREDVEHAGEPKKAGKKAKKGKAAKNDHDHHDHDHDHAHEAEGDAQADAAEDAGEAALVIEEVLDKAGWAYDVVEDDEGYIDFVTMVEEDPLIEATVVRLSEELERVVLYALMRPKAKKERRAEVAELVTRANYGMGDGNFEMDVDSGALRFKVALDFSGVELSPLLVRNMILNTMDTLEVYEGAFLQVLAGKAKAKAAVRAAEKAAEQAGEFS